MTDGFCERLECNNPVFIRCDVCPQLDLPHHFGQYCSADCQRWCYQSHNIFHKVLEGSDRNRVSFTGIVETIALAIKDCSLRRIIPPVRCDGVMSVLLTGCRDSMEGAADYFKLYDLLIQMEVYPPNLITCLEVTLSGPELTSHIPYCHPSGKLKVFRLCGRLQRLFPPTTTSNPAALDANFVSPFSTTNEKINASHYGSFNAYNGAPALAPADALSWNYCCVIMRHPGFSHPKQKTSRGKVDSREPSLLEQWAPAVELLLQKGVLVITTGYSEQQRQPPTPLQANPCPLQAHGQHKQCEKEGVTNILNDSSPSFARHKYNSCSAAGAVSSPETAASLIGTARDAADRNREHHIFDLSEDWWTHDAVNDENILSTLFQVNVVIPRTRNPFFLPHKHFATKSKNQTSVNFATQGLSSLPGSSDKSPQTNITLKKAISELNNDVFYLAFQGKRDLAVTRQIDFFNFMAQHNSQLREVAQSMARDIGGGRLRLPLHLSTAELELEAHGRFVQRNPPEMRLLQHEILAIQKKTSPAQSNKRNLHHDAPLSAQETPNSTEQQTTHNAEQVSAESPPPVFNMPISSPPSSAKQRKGAHKLNEVDQRSALEVTAHDLVQAEAPVSTVDPGSDRGLLRMHFTEPSSAKSSTAVYKPVSWMTGSSSIPSTETLKLPQLTFTRR